MFLFCLFLTMRHALSVCSPFQHSSQILGWKSCIDVHSSPLRLFHFRVFRWNSYSNRLLELYSCEFWRQDAQHMLSQLVYATSERNVQQKTASVFDFSFPLHSSLSRKVGSIQQMIISVFHKLTLARYDLAPRQNRRRVKNRCKPRDCTVFGLKISEEWAATFQMCSSH